MAKVSWARLRRRAFGVVLIAAMLTPLGLALTPPPAAAARAPFIAQVNFQSKHAPTPSGYVADYGLGYTTSAGFGWAQRGTLTPASMVGNGKLRRGPANDLLATVMVVKGTAPPQWIMAVPNGSYDVTVSVGDTTLVGNSRVAINGTVAINVYRSVVQAPFDRVTVAVNVTNGYIVLDAAPGAGRSANARWDYVDIAQQVGRGSHHFTSEAPAAGAEGVSQSTAIALTTDVPVDPTTVSTNTIQLIDSGSGALVPGSFSTDPGSNLIIFQPSERLGPFAVYRVETNDGLRALDGVPFAELTSWFVTSD